MARIRSVQRGGLAMPPPPRIEMTPEIERLGKYLDEHPEELAKFTPRMNKYFPYWPHPKQWALLLWNGREAFYGGAAGGGKGMCASGLCMTQYGERSFFEIEPGNRIYAPDGTLTEVMQVFDRGEQPVFDVTLSDGAKLRVDADHLWYVKMAGKHQKVAIKRSEPGRVVPTWWLVRHLERQAENNREYRPMIPLTAPLEFSQIIDYRWGHKRLIDPYLLGVVLGDGHIGKWVSIASVAAEIHQRIRALGLTIKSYSRCNNVIMDGGNTLGLLRAMELGAARSWNKFVPTPYRLAPVADRIALLQGLFDTDGTVDEDGRTSFCSVSRRLADDVQWLLRSIGFKATIGEKAAGYRKDSGEMVECRTAYNVHVSGQDTDSLFFVSRKKSRCVPQQQTDWRTITNITAAGREQTKCIQVDHPSGLYVANDFIVTHNTDYLLMAAVQFVDMPGYNALLVRRTWGDLNAQGGMIPRSKEWWLGTDAEWNETNRIWTFPPYGSTIKFMHMEHEEDRHRLRGVQVQMIGYDELTEFTQEMFLYGYRSLRKSPVSEIPLRMRSGSNPGQIGHEWAKQRYITGWVKKPMAERDPNILVCLSNFVDNPGIDKEAYRASLELLPPLERKRQLDGDWDAKQGGQIFHRSFFEPLVDTAPANLPMLRAWDLAARNPHKKANDPDWAVGVLMGVDADGIIWVMDMVRLRGTPLEIEMAVRATAEKDGFGVPVFIEQEPGAAGLALMDHYERQVLRGYNFTHERSTGEVGVRAVPWSSYAEKGHVKVLRRDWTDAFLSEHDNFTGEKDKGHDDIVSACTHCFSRLQMPQDISVESYLSGMDDTGSEEAIEAMLRY